MFDRRMACTDDEADFSHIVPLRETGAGRPLFLIHGIFGDVSELHPLAERLDTKRPIYALQARGVDLRQEPHSSIVEMVDAYAQSIRSVQPTGPYALAGYSLGGLIAFELARRFRAEGTQSTSSRFSRPDFMSVICHSVKRSFIGWCCRGGSSANYERCRCVKSRLTLPARCFK